jgi:hypothetical protein
MVSYCRDWRKFFFELRDRLAKCKVNFGQWHAREGKRATSMGVDTVDKERMRELNTPRPQAMAVNGRFSEEACGSVSQQVAITDQP